VAETNISTSNALRKQLWETKLLRATQKEAYLTRLMAEGADAAVQVKTDLEKQQGDKITFGLIPRLSGNWIEDDAILEGNEEALLTYDFSVELKQYRTAVRDNGEMSRKRAMFDLTAEMETMLKNTGGEKLDQIMFDELGIGTGATTNPTQIVYPTSAAGVYASTATASTAKSGLDATNSKLTLDVISYTKMIAKTGRVGTTNRTFEPLRPIKQDGKDYYILVTSPQSLLDVKLTSDFKNAMQNARERSAENPLFRGAVAEWDGIIIHEHENCATAADGGGGSVKWTKACLMGAQSLVFAWGRRPELVEETFDYGNKRGVAFSMVCRPKKPKFNSVDYGSLGIYVANGN
jgi:N4-gp56 family major capsid protein